MTLYFLAMKTYKNIHLGSHLYIPSHLVIMIKADINYSLIYLSNGNKVVVATCLKKLEQRLAEVDSFARVHKSYIINLSYLKSFEEGHFSLENNLSGLVSRRKFKIYKRIVEYKRAI